MPHKSVSKLPVPNGSYPSTRLRADAAKLHAGRQNQLSNEDQAVHGFAPANSHDEDLFMEETPAFLDYMELSTDINI